MPELPEVETVMRGLEPVMAGRRIERAEQRRADLRFPLPERFAERLGGRRVNALRRRAKYILADLDGEETLVMHLGMSGRFTIGHGGKDGRELGEFVHDPGGSSKHDHVVLHMEGGASIVYNDVRRFGCMDLVETAWLDRHPLFAGLGIEPLGGELTPEFLVKAAAGRKTDLKAFLLDQRIIVGLGNIYVCEALFRAGLSPTLQAGRLAAWGKAAADARRVLVGEIVAVLEAALAAGGSTLRDYQHTDGSLGYFQHTFTVYGREGQACVTPGCGTIVRRRVQAGRSTFYCPACQSGLGRGPRASQR